MRLVPKTVPSRISLAGRRCKPLTACGKETARPYTCWERMQRDASAFCPIPAWRWLVQVLTTSQICVLGHCSLLSAYDMATYHNTQQKQVFTAKLQLFHAGIILGFIQALYCSEFLLKAIFWKQNALSSSPHLENSAHSLLATGIMQKTNHESCSEGKNKVFSDPAASRDEAQIRHPRAGAVLRASTSAFIAQASLRGCTQREAFPRLKVFQRAKGKTRFTLVNKQTCSHRLQKPGHPSKT